MIICSKMGLWIRWCFFLAQVIICRGRCCRGCCSDRRRRCRCGSGCGGRYGFYIRLRREMMVLLPIVVPLQIGLVYFKELFVLSVLLCAMSINLILLLLQKLLLEMGLLIICISLLQFLFMTPHTITLSAN